MDRQEVPLLIAVLIIEDMLAVMILTFFSGITDKTEGMIGSIQNLVISICILIIAYMLFVKIVKPILAWMLKNNNSEEIMTFTALALCAGFSALAYYLNLSPAAGAFLAGSIVASLPDVKKFEKAVAPYNLIISSLFFIAVGTLVNFESVQANIMLILVLVLTVIVTRLVAFGLIVYLFANFRGDKMFFSSMAMFSVGEFALLIAQQSQNFNIGLDLMSISAAIIFITAVLMSLTLNHSDKLYHPTNDNVPYGWKKKLEQYSGYIKSISEELDLDNKYSQSLKRNFFATSGSILALLLIIFGWRKLLVFMTSSGVDMSIIMFGYLITLCIITVSLFYILYKGQKVLKSFSDIFANATNNRSVANSKAIVTRAFAAFTLLIIALLFPFVMFMLGLGIIYMIIPFALLVIFGWQLCKISKATQEGQHNETFTTHNTLRTQSHNGIWKM